ncbi:hypothetical protein [Sphingomonas ginsenosidivorax]|nr:hypothetical protein [Sphingomonas ginsenosidivorax]
MSFTNLRHPSEGWGLPVGDHGTSPSKIPAFAGMTAVIDTDIGA